MIVRVVPDVSGLDKRFDYRVPSGLISSIHVGSVVRAELQGRRIAGWVVAIDPDDHFDDGALAELTRVSGRGPSEVVIGLAEWAAHRWVGRLRHFLRAATPRRHVQHIGNSTRTDHERQPTSPAASELLAAGGGVLRLPPTEDVVPTIMSAASLGPALVVEPSAARASIIARRLREQGLSVALVPDEWASAAAGVDVTIGPRIAAWATCRDLAAIVVLDEHDESLQSESSPTWHARDVAIERGRRQRIPLVLTSPTPTLTAIEWAPITKTPPRDRTTRAWPDIIAIDRSNVEPWKRSLLSSELIQELRDTSRTVVCVSNTPGRAGLLACRHCRSLITCEHCDSAVQMSDETQLDCRRCGTQRPVVCQVCGRTALANVRPGVSRLVEEVAAAAGRPAVLIQGTSAGPVERAGVYVGTEAVLHRVASADTVVFLEFDREILAPRYRATEQAAGLVARAARLVGPRGYGGRVLLQTFEPDHPVVRGLCQLDFDSLYDQEIERRRLLKLPPYAGLAEVSGTGAREFIESAGSEQGVDVALVGDEFAVRAVDWDVLADFLGRAQRPPKSRLRIAVDPPR